MNCMEFKYFGYYFIKICLLRTKKTIYMVEKYTFIKKTFAFLEIFGIIPIDV